MITLSEQQRDQLETFEQLALEINRRHNLYSEASAEHFWMRHVQHSLALAAHSFPAGARVVDWGSGGGLPGIPLAVMFPECEFVLVDSVSKKVRAVQTMARRIGLDNVNGWHGRAETWDGTAHYAVSRATAPLAVLWSWTEPVLAPIAARPEDWAPGLICLKGGDLADEIAEARTHFPELDVSQRDLEFTEPYFLDKQVVEVR